MEREWISTAERFPEDGTWVWVTVEDGSGSGGGEKRRFVSMNYYTDLGCWNYWPTSYRYCHITHWMHVGEKPEPCKDELY